MEGKQEETKAEASTQPADQSMPVSQLLALIPPLPAPSTLVPSGKTFAGDGLQFIFGSLNELPAVL